MVEQNGIAGKVLREMDLNETEIYEEIEHLIGYGGKSSFINTLLGRKNLARTSGKPGTFT